MAQRDEMRTERPPAGLVVGQYGIDAQRAPADDRDPAAETREADRSVFASASIRGSSNPDPATMMMMMMPTRWAIRLRIWRSSQALLIGDLDHPAGDLGEVRVRTPVRMRDLSAPGAPGDRNRVDLRFGTDARGEPYLLEGER